MSEKIVLVDGHSILNRAFYGVPPLTNGEGLHTNAVYGFLNILFKILDEEKPEYLAVAFDLKTPTFRHKRYELYKGTRKPMPEELREQVPLIQQVLQAMGVKVVTLEGYEADDVLGTLSVLCEEQGLFVSVLSGDRDLLQLATDKVKIRIPKTKRGGTEVEDYFASDVMAAYQVTPKEFIEVKALMGDASDNIPGVAGVGEKTATKFITQYHSLDGLYENLDSIKAGKVKNSLIENRDTAYLSLELATICLSAPVAFTLEEARIGNLYTEEAGTLFRRLEFKNLLRRFEVEEKPEPSVEATQITDLSLAEELFSKAEAADRIGFHPVWDGELLMVALCLEGHVFFVRSGGFLTPAYLRERCQQLVNASASLIIMDLKQCASVIPAFAEEKNEGKVFDVGLMAYIVNPLKSSYDYPELAADYLGISLRGEKEILGKQSLKTLYDSDFDKVAELAYHNVWTAFSCCPTLEKALEEKGGTMLYQQVERPLAITLLHMEQEGIQADRAALEEYGTGLGEQIEKLTGQIYELAGGEFNVNSPKQLGELLFDRLGLKGGKKTKTGYSTSAEVLEGIRDQHPIVPLVLEYRTLSKLKSTYADGLAGCIRPEDGRIHSTFQQKVTATGRISSTDPNLQNIPIRMELGRQIRKVFVPKPGCCFIDADYSQIELRVMAHLSGDEKLIEAFRNGEDIHRMTASQVFHVPFEEVTSLQRRNAKAVNFGIIYGISAFGLSRDLGISRGEAGEYIGKYFETYPKVKEYVDSLVELGKKEGYVSTMYGRRRPIPELSSSNFMTRSFGERVAMNSPIQGTAADIIKIAMIKVDKRLRREGLRSRLLLQVHDELLIEAHEEELEVAMRVLQEEMVGAAQLLVPLEVDAHVGNNWYEAK